VGTSVNCLGASYRSSNLGKTLISSSSLIPCPPIGKEVAGDFDSDDLR
jgi:hypothetical protein